MKNKKTPETFQDVLDHELKRFGLGPEYAGLFLKVQEKALARDEWKEFGGAAGLMKFEEILHFNNDTFWDDAKRLGEAQKATKKGRKNFERESTVAIVIPSVDAERNVNPIFFLPGTPESLTRNARKLEKTLLRKKEIETEGNRGERK